MASRNALPGIFARASDGCGRVYVAPSWSNVKPSGLVAFGLWSAGLRAVAGRAAAGMTDSFGCADRSARMGLSTGRGIRAGTPAGGCQTALLSAVSITDGFVYDVTVHLNATASPFFHPDSS